MEYFIEHTEENGEIKIVFKWAAVFYYNVWMILLFGFFGGTTAGYF